MNANQPQLNYLSHIYLVLRYKMVTIDIIHQTQQTEILKYSYATISNSNSDIIEMLWYNQGFYMLTAHSAFFHLPFHRHHRLFNNHQLYSSFKRTSILISQSQFDREKSQCNGNDTRNNYMVKCWIIETKSQVNRHFPLNPATR